MPVTPLPNVGSQLDRAICAYLIANGCGTAADVHPAYGVKAKTYPNTVVKSIQSKHDPMTTGNEVWDVQIQFKASAVDAVGAANAEEKRVALDARVGAALAYMLQGDDGTLDFTAGQITAAGRALASSPDPTVAANNADMAAFTLTHLYYHGSIRGEPDDEGASWVEIRKFECHACPSNVD